MSILIETIFTDGLAHLSYLVGDKTSGIAAIIDPRRDVQIYLDLAREKGVKITHVLETHNHADFVSGSRELVQATGMAKPYLSVEGGAKYGFDHAPLCDNTQIELGKVVLTARHTPGHTPEHISFTVSDSDHPDEISAVFSGDCLFADSVGRPDLLGADQAEAMTMQLYHSLHHFFMKLDDGVVVYPAHGAGSPCGADIGDRLVTSIGYERRHNRALQIQSASEFTTYVLDSSPPEPRYYQRMKKLNAEGPPLLGGLPKCPPLLSSEFRTASQETGVQLIDNRDMLAFGGGHIPGAWNIGPKPMSSIWAGWLIDENVELLLILGDSSRLPKVIAQFARVGCTRFKGYLASGMEGWISEALPIETLEQLSVHRLHDQLAELQVIDVRSPEEWENGHIPGATYLFLPELKEKFGELSKNKPTAVYCASGYRASIGASLLQDLGFKDVRNVPGSWEAWTAAKLATEKPKVDQQASDTDRN